MACRQCNNRTWLKKWQFGLWVMRNGGLIQFAKDIKDLTGWPPLPDQDYKKGRKLFCRVCKCWLPAKSYVESERCPVGNPAWEVEV